MSRSLGVRMPKFFTYLAAITAISLFQYSLQAAAQSAYPESALEEAYKTEATEKTKLEELERKAAREKAEYDRKVHEVEQQIKAKQQQTELYKMKSEEINSQLETLRAEIFSFNTKNRTVDDDLQSYELAFQKLQTEQDQHNRQFVQLKSSLEEKQLNLNKLRQKYELNSAKYRSDKEKMVQSISALEVEIAAADAKRAEYESEEMKNRVEWVAVNKENQDKKDLKATYLADASEAKKKLDLAKRDLAQSQTELSKLSSELSKISNQTQRDIQSYEKEMMEVVRKKALAEAEKIRVEAEKEKLHKYVEHVKETLDTHIKSYESTQSALIESRLALESVKSDLTQVIAKGQKVEFEQQKSDARVRGLASAEQLATVADGKRVFTLTQTCPARRSPASEAEIAFSATSGQQYLGTTSGARRWVKIPVEGNKHIYIEKSCGNFPE